MFGIHGGHVNVTDGHHVYMRASIDAANGPIEDFTLMPTHMRSRFAVAELTEWEPAPPFSFTKGLRTMRVDSLGGYRINSWQHGTLLWDIDADPHQIEPIVDDAVELRMLELLVRLLRENDAPASVYERLGLPIEGPVSAEHLRAAADSGRAAAIAEQLPRLEELPARRAARGPHPRAARRPRHPRGRRAATCPGWSRPSWSRRCPRRRFWGWRAQVR